MKCDCCGEDNSPLYMSQKTLITYCHKCCKRRGTTVPSEWMMPIPAVPMKTPTKRVLPRHPAAPMVGRDIMRHDSPYAISELSDGERYINRFLVESSSGKGKYCVSYDTSIEAWTCSCRGCITHGSCKHLTREGLPGKPKGRAYRSKETPIQVQVEKSPWSKDEVKQAIVGFGDQQ